jgi:hypothetical protein
LARPGVTVRARGARHVMAGGGSTAANQREDLHRRRFHRTVQAPDKEGGVTAHPSGPGMSACAPKAAATLRLAVARSSSPCRHRGGARRQREGRDGGVRPILRRGGAERFAAMAIHRGALAEERGDRAGPRWRVRCLGLNFSICATPRGCRGTCSTVRGSSEQQSNSRGLMAWPKI